jgi:hypothetical protein
MCGTRDTVLQKSPGTQTITPVLFRCQSMGTAANTWIGSWSKVVAYSIVCLCLSTNKSNSFATGDLSSIPTLSPTPGPNNVHSLPPTATPSSNPSNVPSRIPTSSSTPSASSQPIFQLSNQKNTTSPPSPSESSQPTLTLLDQTNVTSHPGVTCANRSWFKNGFCDPSNNVDGCEYDGGDCCESTCGAGYDVVVECGSNG